MHTFDPIDGGAEDANGGTQFIRTLAVAIILTCITAIEVHAKKSPPVAGVKRVNTTAIRHTLHVNKAREVNKADSRPWVQPRTSPASTPVTPRTTIRGAK